MFITNESWDFLERHVPDYHTREDVLRQSELQLFIDGHESEITGLTREEAMAERDRILYHSLTRPSTATPARHSFTVPTARIY